MMRETGSGPRQPRFDDRTIAAQARQTSPRHDIALPAVSEQALFDSLSARLGGGGLPAVGRVELPAQLLDLMPTIIDLAGLEAELPYQGESLAVSCEGERNGSLPEHKIQAEPSYL